MAKDVIKERIIIDLEDSQRSLVPISESLFVDFPPREFDGMMGRFLKKLSMKRSLKKVEIGVRDIKCPKEIVLKGSNAKRNLFSLVVDGEHHGITETPISVTLTKERTPFQLYFQPSLIADCKVVQGTTPKDVAEIYSVTGTAYVRNLDGEDLDTQDFQVDIEFKDLKSDVKVEIIGQRRLQYKELPKDRVVKFGELRVTNPRKFSRSPKINFDGRLTLVGADGKDMGMVKNEAGELLPRARFSDSTKDIIKLEGLRSGPVEIDGNLEYSPYHREIEIDLKDIANPLQAFDTLTLKIDGKWAYSADPDVPNLVRESKDIRLMKDTQGTEMRVSLDGQYLTSGNESILDTFEFSPGGAFRDEKTVELANIATDSSRGGKLRIMAPRIVTTIAEEGLRVYGPNGKAVDFDKLVSLEGDFAEESREQGYVDVPNGTKLPEKLKIMFNPAEVYSINNGGQYSFTLNSVIEIDYYENGDGRPWNEIGRKTFRILLRRPMYILPFPEWLCVDYGSSAIVGMYKGKLLDLNSRRKDILNQIGASNKDWHPRTKGNENETEKDTVFISSDLLLNTITGINADSPVSTLCGEQTVEELDYSKTAVSLAPTNNIAKNNYQRILPCLKLLVGNRFLPENPDYNAYEYYRRDGGENVSKVKLAEAKEKDEPNSLASINVLFDEAYKVVFRHYLTQLIPHIDRVNRLVLTYPNSYTPDHLKVLKTIANDTFRYLREGQLQFVSESDAVAAYYMDHWSEYNSGLEIKRSENILVYDMGAGTLDLTYLSKEYDKKKDVFDLNIKGKIGISKAGNYLDFILASIVAEKGGRVTKELAKTERPAGVNADRIARGRIALKDFVKNKLKPLLNEKNTSQTLTFSYNDEDISVKIGEVLAHKEFQQYLHDVTSKVLKSMENYLNSTMPIDTVILSGRSVRLQPLQQALKDALSRFPTDRVEGIRFLDLDINGEHDRQKTAVVEGATKYAGSYRSDNSKVKIHSRRLYASFGVAFKRLGGELDYVELASHTDMPLGSERGSKDFTVKTLKGIGHADEVRLIQTFLPADQTLKALKTGDFEYISEMNTYSLSSFGGRDSLDMAVNVDRHNQVSLYVDGRPTVGTTPKGVDLNNVITRRSIWPATI